MKEFEKWDKNVRIKTWSGNVQERHERKWYREQTWKAALQWVLKINEENHYPEDTFPMIREELELLS